MQSWELMQQQRNKLLIATLIAPPLMVSIDWAYAFTALEKPPLYDVMRIAGLPFDAGRTQAANQCLNGGYDWLLQLDADVLPPPNTITRLMSYRLPIVSALYHQKFPTWTGMEAKYMPCIFNEARDAQGNLSRAEISFKYGELVEAHFVPSGCILIHRSVFERFLAAGIKRFYQWTLTADEPHGLSEDFFFSHKCWELGYKVVVDTALVALHETEAKIDVRGLTPRI